MGQRKGSCAVVAAGAALCTMAMLPVQATAAPEDGPGGSSPYRTADGAKKAPGAKSSADAPMLRPGIYTDTIGPGEVLYYAVTLDAKSGPFLSAVALPRPGASVAYGDGLRVVLESSDGTECSTGDASFGSGEQARPIADYAFRTVTEDGPCHQGGPYYFRVERTSDPASDKARWPIEIRYMSEPGVRGTTPTAPPTRWNSASPSPPAGQPQQRRGGTGFNDAPALEDGVWKDRLRPGETRFYRIPLDWGQQLSGSLELANASMTKDSGYASGGLTYELYNTARGRVDGNSAGYDGEQRAVPLERTAPVAYTNRYNTSNREASGMRFAGWYYLVVSIHPEVGTFTTGTIPLTLRLHVDGGPNAGPQYDGDAAAAGFGLTDGDRKAAEKGLTAAESARRDSLRFVAVAGIGTGTVLLLGLGAWTLAGRRRAPGVNSP